ncbi:hypothetical protein ILYODFUR_025706 [Ilyodon furcidens]|uniref:Uncharacterized protein n=1 Tax=Ilyodon furcidens TaxID=33524 RepID=A0ABV0VI38_9TELE
MFSQPADWLGKHSVDKGEVRLPTSLHRSNQRAVEVGPLIALLFLTGQHMRHSDNWRGEWWVGCGVGGVKRGGWRWTVNLCSLDKGKTTCSANENLASMLKA